MNHKSKFSDRKICPKYKSKFSFFCLIISLIVQLSFITCVYALFEDTGSARPSGMGGAFIGVADDANTLLWNPAGVNQLENTELSFMYANPLASHNQDPLKINYLSVIYPVNEGNNGALGFGWKGVNSGGLSKESTFILNYGIDMGNFIPELLMDTLYVGFNLKALVYTENVKNKDYFDLILDSKYSKNALTGDFGLLYKPLNKLSVGIALQNLNQPTMQFIEEQKIPFKWGLGSSLEVDDDKLVALDITRQGDEWKANVGGEMWFLNKVAGIRTGINSDSSAVGITVDKMSYKGIDFKIDYTFEYPFDLKKNYKTHYFSIGAKIGSQKEDNSSSKNEKKENPKQIIPYFIGPNDELEIVVRNHPEFSGRVKVDPYGNILIPLLGEISVQEMTSQELAKSIEKQVLPYMSNPKASVVITNYQSKVVYVFGQVARPGKYFIRGDSMPLRDVILEAGLPTGLAALWRVYIIKSGREKPPYKVVNLYKVLYKGELKNNIDLEPGDVVYVPLTVLGKLSTSLGNLLDPFIKSTSIAEPINNGVFSPGE